MCLVVDHTTNIQRPSFNGIFLEDVYEINGIFIIHNFVWSVAFSPIHVDNIDCRMSIGGCLNATYVQVTRVSSSTYIILL